MLSPTCIGGNLRPSSSSSAVRVSLPSSYTARKPGSTIVVPDARKPCASLAASSTLTVLSVAGTIRSEEHTSELQSLMRISYAVFCLKKKIRTYKHRRKQQHKLT